MTKKVFRFLISSDDELLIHGRYCRATIKKDVMNFNKNITNPITGFAKNVKGKPEVEVFAVCEEKASVWTFIDNFLTKNEKLSGFRFPTIDDIKEVTWGDEYKNIMDFQIKREDDLTEMVWALQGAGQEFKTSSEQIGKILEEIQERDKKKKMSVLQSLNIELHNLYSTLVKIDSDNPHLHSTEILDELNTLCLESCIKYPPDTNEDFLLPLHETFNIIQGFRSKLKAGKISDALQIRNSSLIIAGGPLDGLIKKTEEITKPLNKGDE